MSTRTDARAATRDLEAAQAGDRTAFDRLVSPYRQELLAHCYRMLGSIHDADDALQDALLRAWRGLPGFAGRSSVRTWLHKITTNAALAMAERNGRRHLPIDPTAATSSSSPGGEPAWLEPFVDPDDARDPRAETPTAAIERRESVELAFVAAVQHLRPNQRAVLLLRDVLGFSANETAVLLDTTVASVTSSLQRARRTVRDHRPERSQQETLRSLGDHEVQAVITRYVEAWEHNDARALLALLTEDATFSMPPSPSWYQGRDSIERFLHEQPMAHRWRLVPTTAGGQLAFACYTWAPPGWVAHSLDVVTLEGSSISRITAFNQADLVHRLGLPPHL